MRGVLVAKSVVSGILSSIFLILALYKFSLTTSFPFTSLSLLKSACTNLSVSNLFTLVHKLLKLVGKFFHLSISNLCTSDFRLAQSKDDVLNPVAFFKSALLLLYN